MKFKAIVEYDYPTIHKPPVKAEIVLHGDRVVTDNIKWLEQEPCEDAISRQSVLKKLQNEINTESEIIQRQLAKEEPCGTVRDNGRLGRLQGINWVKNIIQSLPSVHLTEKVGEWIDICNSKGTVIAVRCSNCEKSPKHAIKSDFCPHCGANMIKKAR